MLEKIVNSKHIETLEYEQRQLVMIAMSKMSISNQDPLNYRNKQQWGVSKRPNNDVVCVVVC